MKRTDDFEIRRQHLKDLTDDQLRERFWSLSERVVEPMLKMGQNHTTPAIERSILLRMGFSSLEAKPIVEGVMKKSLMGKGAGNIVWRLSEKLHISIREAGIGLIEGKYWDEVDSLFKKE
jgi:D-ornithine 4,5-aminomutase subunit alpha